MMTNFILNKDRSDGQMPSTKSCKDTTGAFKIEPELRRRSGTDVRRAQHRGDNFQDHKPGANHQVPAMSMK